ncbi:hypothetical protein CK203_113247 [Vitis vinifera]|uniref:Uncharacterized protein n=1 Tax=Vitis vinifera TaxID=29760 RepID=A0A438CC25_VITVI|nr:hypothetical protein CK203_113247 [Vitis vinifera]
MPSSPPQHRYATWRSSTSPPPEPSVRRIPPKRARTSGPGESSRHAQPNPQALADSQRLYGIASEAIIRGLWSPCHLLRAIQIVEPGHFIQSYISILRPCDSSQSCDMEIIDFSTP